MIYANPVPAPLIEAACAGGAPEADDLIRVVWPRAYRIALSVLRNSSLAEDAAQEACAILFRSISRLRSVEAFGVWFYRIVVRQAMSLEKRNLDGAVVFENHDASEIDACLLRIDILNAMVALSPPQRAAIGLYYYAEMNSREVAAVLGIPDSSVRFHIMRAKRTLENALKNHDIENPHGKEASYGAA